MTAETVTCTKVRCPLGNPAHASEKNTHLLRRSTARIRRAARERGPRPRGGAHAAELVRLVRLDLAAEPERTGAARLVGRAARRMRRERVPDGRR